MEFNVFNVLSAVVAIPDSVCRNNLGKVTLALEQPNQR
jgi:hypothetical protein